MRYDSEHKQAARAKIVRQASARLRKDGIAPVGLRALMADAGLTHGAFYAHFTSRDELVADAVADGFVDTLATLSRAVAASAGGRGLEAYVETYLQPLHLERVDRGCSASALAPEIARGSLTGRVRFDGGVERLVGLLAAQLPDGAGQEERLSRAYAVFAGLMGALQLARAFADPVRQKMMLREGRCAALALARLPWVDPGSQARSAW